MRKREYDVPLFLLLAVLGGFCACNQSKETGITATPAGLLATPLSTPEAAVTGFPENTKTPSQNPALTREPSPTPVSGMEAGLLPIDAGHFTSEVFREYISRCYDSNKDGVLSKEELDNVTEIEIRYYEKGFDKERLDGFEFFPELASLSVSNAEEVVLQNHPDIQSFGGEEGGIGTVRIENCPSLSRIGFYSFGISSLYISNVSPKASFGLAGNCPVRDMALDADIMLEMEDYSSAEPVFAAMEDGTLCYTFFQYNQADGKEVACLEKIPIKFLHQKEVIVPFSEEYWKECLQKTGLDFYQVQILEKEGEVCNAEDDKEYEVCFEVRDYQRNPVILSDQPRVLYSERMRFPLDTDALPAAEQIVFRPARIHKVRALEYSPNRGASLLVTWDISVIFQNGAEEQVLGVLEKQEQYCFLDAGGGVRVYPCQMAWEKWKGEETGPEMPAVLIDEAHFSSPVFRRYIEGNYNTDYYEGLTTKEQEAVEIMDFSDSVRFYGETLDGFEYFPCLSELYLGDAETLIVENHPSLKVIGGHSRGLKKVVIRNCPELRRIDLELSGVEEVIVEGCEKLK